MTENGNISRDARHGRPAHMLGPPSANGGSQFPNSRTISDAVLDSDTNTGYVWNGPAIKHYEQNLQEHDYSNEPLLKSPGKNEGSDAEVDDSLPPKASQNLVWVMVVVSLSMVSYCIFMDAYSQWLYAWFEEDVLGSNVTKLNNSISSNPCFVTNNTSPYQDQLDEAQSRASRFSIWTMLVTLVPAFITNMILGVYGDRIGRRILFLVPMAGYMVKTGFTVAVAYWHLNVYLLLIGVAFDGISGSMPALFMGTYVYTADNTSKKKGRSFGMVVAQTVIKIFYSLAHLGVGFFISHEGYVLPLFTAFLVSILTFIVTAIFLRETLEKKTTGKCINFFTGIKGVFGFYFVPSENPKHKRKDFILLGLVFFLFGTLMGVSIQTFYLMNEPLCWGSEKIGYVTTFQGLLSSFATLILMKILQRFFSDEIICVVSLLSAAGGRLMFAFAKYDWMIYAAFSIGVLDLIVLAVIRAVLSRMVPLEKRGSLFASVAVLEVATIAAAGAGLDAMYSATVSYWHGLTYFVIGCCCVVAALIMVVHIVMVHLRDAGGLSYVVVEEVEEDDVPRGGGPLSVNAE